MNSSTSLFKTSRRKILSLSVDTFVNTNPQKSKIPLGNKARNIDEIFERSYRRLSNAFSTSPEPCIPRVAASSQRGGNFMSKRFSELSKSRDLKVPSTQYQQNKSYQRMQSEGSFASTPTRAVKLNKRKVKAREKVKSLFNT